VTKTNRFTLIATILLGVLLYSVLRFAHDLNLAWDGSVLDPPPATDDAQTPTQPRIESTRDLHALLADKGIDAVAALSGYARWSDARGFTGTNQLFGSVDVAPYIDLAAIEEAELVALSDAGDAAASQALGARMLFVDSFRSIDFYRRAAGQGSTYALLRIGSLLEALDAVAAGNQTGDPVQRQRIADLTRRGIGNSLRLTALGYVITAVRDGGPPIVDYALLAWLDRMNDTTTSAELATVCEWSEQTLLNIARERVRRGKPAITTIAPPVFFAIPDLAERLPCGWTSYPIETLLDLTHCTVTRVRNAADEELDTYICLAG